MTALQTLYHTYKRHRTLQTNFISSMPVVILMPHSSCNCRCVMCDIWKDNKNLKQLTEADIISLLTTFKKLGTRQVVMSGGEALLNANFFKFCEILKKEQIKISLLSTGMAIKKHAIQIVEWVDDIVVSLDGDEPLHDAIRNITGAFKKLREGIIAIKALSPNFPITARTVIHRLNFKQWRDIIKSAKDIGVNSISFLPADVSSNAFNRENIWNETRQYEIVVSRDDLPELKQIIAEIVEENREDFISRFIAESPDKMFKIYTHYAAFYGINDYARNKCNAPWVSAVVEADGTVRPCFFHKAYGNIKTDPLERILNSPNAIEFRKNLDMSKDATCKKCVCYLNLAPGASI